MAKRLTTIRLAEADDEAIRRIKERWGIPSDAAAISFALRVVAQTERLEVVTPTQEDQKEESR